MTEKRREFGKRSPLPPPTTPPVKRSGHVALLLMGSLAVGGTASTLIPRQSCAPPSPGMAEPAVPSSDGSCTQRSSSSGSSGGGGSGGSRFYDSGNSGRTAVAEAETGGVSRGGFGSFARALGFSRGG
jgi:hypothetical protein